MPIAKELIDGFGNVVVVTVGSHTLLFSSTEQTGNGAEQDIAHGLGVTPSIVAIYVTGDARVGWAAYSVVEGVHDGTNVKATVTTNVKYRVLALGTLAHTVSRS